jgi:MFS family permease
MSSAGSRRWWALGAVFLTILCVGVDSTVLSVALPTLAKSLHASETDLQWFSSGYFLVLAAAMLPSGLLGDRFGHKRVFLVSLGLFAAGSAGCAFLDVGDRVHGRPRAPGAGRSGDYRASSGRAIRSAVSSNAMPVSSSRIFTSNCDRP